MHERQAIKKRVKSLLEGIWLSFYCYPATTEEGVLRVLLPGIGVGKHSFGTGFTYSLAEICQVDLLFISEVLWHVGGAGVTLIDRLIRRVKIK